MAQNDREALVTLFNATRGPNWKQTTNWCSGAPLSDWYGVKANDQGRVVELTLVGNNLRGPIPPELGELAALQYLSIGNNQLSGPIPPELKNLRELEMLELYNNRLTGPIPQELGSLVKLVELWLYANGLTGHIPQYLGALGELRRLYLNGNNLTGPIPAEVGKLGALYKLDLSGNLLTGSIPPELGNLRELRTLLLSNNQLTGHTPNELGALSELQYVQLEGNKLTGGLENGESVDSWKARLREQQQATTGSGQEEKGGVPRVPELLVPLEGGGNTVSSGSAPLPQEDGDAARLFREQVSSSAGLDALTRGNPGALEEVQRAINANARLSPDAALGGTENRRELARLVAMAADLSEVVVRHAENKDATQKELALQPFAQAYYIAVRAGICNAYLAACVVSSSWVCASKTGRMGKVGKVMKGLSSVPAVGVLAGPMGTALEAGDGYVQTRRLEKISGLAPDAVECCSLARKLGLLLTDGLSDDAISMIDEVEEVCAQATPGAGGGAGVSGSSPDSGLSPDDLSEEEYLLDYVVEEVAGFEPTDSDGKKRGKRDLRKLLKAVRRGCLEGTKSTEQKVEKLLRVIHPEAEIRSTATRSAPKDLLVPPPVAAPSHDGGLDQAAELATLRAQLQAFKLDNEKRRSEIEAMKLDNKKLRGEVNTMKKHLPKPRAGPDGSVDAGRGQLFKQKQETKAKTKEEFWRDAESAATTEEHLPVTRQEWREFRAVNDERHREHDADIGQLLGEKKSNRKGRG